ncbi:spore germination protein GerW family protein [Candidatus Cloacimonadota bacterium]
MNFNEDINSVSDALKKSADIKIVFGSSQEIKGRTIIPVSTVKYAFGTGSGKHFETENDSVNSAGKGAGGGLKNEPLGLFEITEEKVCFKPVININHILKVFIIWMFISFLKKLFLKKK